jgi:hypothetical protein
MRRRYAPTCAVPIFLAPVTIDVVGFGLVMPVLPSPSKA